MQQQCHKWFTELFDNKADGYKWLKEECGIGHFSELKYPKDMLKLQCVYDKLYIKSFQNP